MIKWRQEDFGFRFILSGIITPEETDKWVSEVKEVITQMDSQFCAWIDMREIEIIPNECKLMIEDIQKYCRDNGMTRSVIVLCGDLTAMQLKIISKKTGIYEWERYIDSNSHPDWEKLSMDWILHAIDPDKIPETSNKSS